MDSDYAGNLYRKRPMAGYILILAGAPICWRIFLQFTVALSTIEVGYMALI